MPNKTIRFTLLASDEASINVLKERLKLPTPQAVIRHLLTTAYAEEVENQRRYGSRGLSQGKVAKQSRDEAVAMLSAMNDIDLTKHLIGIGYCKAPHEPADELDTEFREGMWTDEKGNRFFVEERWSISQKKRTYAHQVFTFDELVRDLIKNKFI